MRSQIRGETPRKAYESCRAAVYRTHTPKVSTSDFGKDSKRLNKLWGWVDADVAAELDIRRSHKGYALMLNGGAVSLKSTKQKSVSLSTAGRTHTRELARNLIADLDRLTLNPQESTGVKAQLCFGFCLFAVRQVLQKINRPRSSLGHASELADHW